MDERKTVKDKPYYGAVAASCEADKYPGEKLLDTRVEIHIDPFSITWDDRQKLVEALGKVIEKFQI